MTTSTVHHFGIPELSTFRLRCRIPKCGKLTVIEIESWTPTTSGDGRVLCPHCGSDWGAEGEALADFASALRVLQEKPRHNKPPIGLGRIKTTRFAIEGEISVPAGDKGGGGDMNHGRSHGLEDG